MIRLLLLVLLTACATKPPPSNPRHMKYVDPFQNADVSWKAKLSPKDKKQIVNVYWDFYANSLKNKCTGLKYKTFYTGNKSLGVPGIVFGELKPDHSGKKNIIQGGSFDLSTEGDGQRYQFFQLETAELEGKEPSSFDFRIVLLRTGKPSDIRYVACSDKAGRPIICTEDKLITKIVNVNDMDKLCHAIRSRRTFLPKDKFLDEVLAIIARLEINQITH